MSLYAVKKNGKYLDVDGPSGAITTSYQAASMSAPDGAEVVELHECHKVIVSQEEADYLTQLAVDVATAETTQTVMNIHLSVKMLLAYVNGWEVAKSYIVQVPHVAHYVYCVKDGELTVEPDTNHSRGSLLTMEQINQYDLNYEEREVYHVGH